MADPHITYKQWQEPETLGGKWHEPGETGDYSHVYDLETKFADGAVGVNPVLAPEPPVLSSWQPAPTPDPEEQPHEEVQ